MPSLLSLAFTPQDICGICEPRRAGTSDVPLKMHTNTTFISETLDKRSTTSIQGCITPLDRSPFPRSYSSEERPASLPSLPRGDGGGSGGRSERPPAGGTVGGKVDEQECKTHLEIKVLSRQGSSGVAKGQPRPKRVCGGVQTRPPRIFESSCIFSPPEHNPHWLIHLTWKLYSGAHGWGGASNTAVYSPRFIYAAQLPPWRTQPGHKEAAIRPNLNKL